jgi:hypothetical protein
MRSINGTGSQIVTFSPSLQTSDPAAAYWLKQVTVRLRREICWARHERGISPQVHPGILPPLVDAASESLGLQRNWEEKKAFFKTDATARYLSDQLKVAPETGTSPRGSFGWVLRELELNRASAFILAMAALPVFDSAAGSVISACLNDPGKLYPTLSLAQKLWDRPEDILPLSDPAHPLFRLGLLHQPLQTGTFGTSSVIRWEQSIAVPTVVAECLLYPARQLPEALTKLEPLEQAGDIGSVDVDIKQIESALTSAPIRQEHPGIGSRLRIVPVLGKKGAAHRETVRTAAALTGRQVVECRLPGGVVEDQHFPAHMAALATFCWLTDRALYLGPELLYFLQGDTHLRQQHFENLWSTLSALPVTLYISLHERPQMKKLPDYLLHPILFVPEFTFYKRLRCWQTRLGARAEGLETSVSECSRRFRYEKEEVQQITDALIAQPGQLEPRHLVAACRAHLDLDLGELAQKVTPRFREENLVLPNKQDLQFREVVNAMQSLTEVHYDWGTAAAWNESGIAVLFAGPPGTGKTMAAEILARDLELPIYRIDLSQVVNKYIGETEKNLKRLFDAADVSDMILFFDEADSLFGRRTEVKDAHDRYANLEISYLLERMERFKGLAILASNRKKDLDDAFMRRLRYIIDFPFPETEQRKRIWQQVIPGAVDDSDLDFEFLAARFQLTGGHIRSIVLNACLQDAALQRKKERIKANSFKGKLTMEQVIIAVKREFDKMDQKPSIEQFGPYAAVIKKLEKNGEY